jgi:hypothetical protein
LSERDKSIWHKQRLLPIGADGLHVQRQQDDRLLSEWDITNRIKERLLSVGPDGLPAERQQDTRLLPERE